MPKVAGKKKLDGGVKKTKKDKEMAHKDAEIEEEVVIGDDKENLAGGINETSTSGGLFSLFCK